MTKRSGRGGAMNGEVLDYKKIVSVDEKNGDGRLVEEKMR